MCLSRKDQKDQPIYGRKEQTDSEFKFDDIGSKYRQVVVCLMMILGKNTTICSYLSVYIYDIICMHDNTNDMYVCRRYVPVCICWVPWHRVHTI